MGHKEAQQVLDHCDYGSAKKFLLYRVAELVNPHNGYKYWQRPANAGAEVGLDPRTVSKYMNLFAKDGWLEKTKEGGGRSNPSEYRWAETAPPIAVSDTATPGAQTATQGAQTATPMPKKPTTPSLLEEQELNEEKDPAIGQADQLCEELAEYIERSGVNRPTITKAWRADMERMIRIDQIEPSRIQACMHWIFRGAGDWWIPNIRSPKKLRQQYPQLLLQARRQKANGMSKSARAVQSLAPPAPDVGKPAQLTAADFAELPSGN